MGNIVSEEEKDQHLLPNAKNNNQEQHSTNKVIFKQLHDRTSLFANANPTEEEKHKCVKVTNTVSEKLQSEGSQNITNLESSTASDIKLNVALHKNPCDLEIGCQLSVRWPHDGQYYKCQIISKEHTKYKLLYDDNTWDLVDLRYNPYKLLSWPTDKTGRKRKIMEDSDKNHDDKREDNNQDQKELKTKARKKLRKITTTDEKYSNKSRQSNEKKRVRSSKHKPEKIECKKTNQKDSRFRQHRCKSKSQKCENMPYNELSDSEETQSEEIEFEDEGYDNSKVPSIVSDNEVMIQRDKSQGNSFQIKAKYDEIWLHRFNKLLDYKNQFGHCNVPQTFKPDKSLGVWVSEQRMLYKRSELAEDRIKFLEEIGFEWDRTLATKIYIFRSL